ncbi:MAG: arylsulfatase [Lentisphaerae bacterium]|jgi:arylsulfatase A|nr:arylsulfatase [Lentisphaerota bacterium]MBT4821930.1 arylsulfatase [Lentisphaerota bacterium]MBT5607212.1 arylsulfatase [Lentisphaerota bacterium]MBT7054458.1 arylsulfatase [Lentisphaerota bacterium]MBT7842662.1 arylsulfatase [Lentisphaerota bacterium]
MTGSVRSVLLLLLFAFSANSQAAGRHPNILVILADDLGYGSAGCYGADGKLLRTPGMDRLAREGRRFADANATSSVCSPTRYSVLTGRYCWRTSLKKGVLGVFSPLHVERERLTLATLAKRNGYRTAAVGKWHLGYGDGKGSLLFQTDYAAELSPGPLDLGFDYHFSVPANHGDITGVFIENRFVYGLRKGRIPKGMTIPGPDPDDENYQATYTATDLENKRAASRILDLDAPRRKNPRVMATLTDKAIRWIETQPEEKPFFLFLTPVAVHNPITPDRDLAEGSAAGLYGDWIHELDRSVERMLDALDRLDRSRNTLVIFTSDNGGVFKPYRESLQTEAYKAGLKINGPFRGGKHSVWEGGFRVPFLVRWPGHVPAGTVCSDMVSLSDILATLAAVLGHPLPRAAEVAEDSYNQLPAFLGKGIAPAREDMIVHSSDGVFAIRRGPWKWIEGVPAAGVKRGALKIRAAEHKPQLYNLVEDPAETRDVSADHPKVAAGLKALLGRYRRGGYSRELPPPMPPEVAAPIPPLPPLTGQVVLRESLTAASKAPWAAISGTWAAQDSGQWGTAVNAKRPATLRGPLPITDGTLQYELSFGRADRHSLRIHAAGEGNRSFRVTVWPTRLDIAKNPEKGETAPTFLARYALELKNKTWYTLRITFVGDTITTQCGGVTATAKHAIFAEPKERMFLQWYDGDGGLRSVVVTR